MSDIASNPYSADTPPKAANEIAAPQARAGEWNILLWPGVLIVALMWIVSQVPGWIAPGTFTQFLAMFWGPIVGAVAYIGWWLFASRISWTDRGLGLAAFVIVGIGAYSTYHSSISVFGLFLSALPTTITAWLVWLIVSLFATSHLFRRVGLVIVFVLTWGYFSLFRMDGVDGSFKADMRWRWNPTAEEKFLAEKQSDKAATKTEATSEPLQAGAADWPAFRGVDRDGRRAGEQIETDWKQNPPRELWRHRVGPGWSSFAVVGNRLFTQEQRGEVEFVICYDADTGAEIWAHGDKARFTEAVAGPGPRATPTFHEGYVYALGGAGRLNCLDAATGRPKWSRDMAADSEATTPTWGFSASPLVVQGIVTVFAGGPQKKSVLGYHAENGEIAWTAGDGGFSYCSLQQMSLDGKDQLVLTSDAGLVSFDPTMGDILWRHDWTLEGGMARVTQPTLVGDSDLLLGTGFGYGTQRVHVSREGKEWKTEEVWTSKAIKPYFNDLVVHDGFIYGFDSNIFTCVGLDDGKGKWKARGYGNGQVLLLPDQGLLLVLSEQGEVALLKATPERHTELGKFQALTGKTWNHPVVARGKLFVRNGEEAAAYHVGPASAR